MAEKNGSVGIMDISAGVTATTTAGVVTGVIASDGIIATGVSSALTTLAGSIGGEVALGAGIGNALAVLAPVAPGLLAIGGIALITRGIWHLMDK